LDYIYQLIFYSFITNVSGIRISYAFLSLNLTKDLGLFDIKKIKGNFNREYYRIRKGKYRAIFYMLNDDLYIIYIGKREEVYDKWQ